MVRPSAGSAVRRGVDRLRAEATGSLGNRDHAVARLRGVDASRRPGCNRPRTLLKQLGEATRCLEHDNLAEIFAAVLSHPRTAFTARDELADRQHGRGLRRVGRTRFLRLFLPN